MKRFDYDAALREFAELAPGWDSYNGHAISPDVIRAVDVFLLALFMGRAWLVPTAAGGVAIEVNQEGVDVELEFFPSGEIAGFHREHS